MKLLEINHLKKSFGDLDVLHDISMTVEEGEVVSIIGPSGSGKSTLLRCATMLETMNGGDLIYCGETAVNNGQYASKQKLREIKGYYGLVFQNFNLFPHYSTLKNLMDAPIHIQKREKEEVRKEAMQLLKDVGLEDKADSYPCQLSGGQQQRVAIARALASDAQVILADEPTGNLDEQTAAGITSILKDAAHSSNKCVIVVTHSNELAKEADVVFRLRRGELQILDLPALPAAEEHDH